MNCAGIRSSLLAIEVVNPSCILAFLQNKWKCSLTVFEGMHCVNDSSRAERGTNKQISDG